MDQGSGKFNTIAKLLRAPFSSWYAVLGVVAAVAATGGLAYLFREQLASAYSSSESAVLGTLGLGVAPVALWLVVFSWALAKRRSWFTRINLWIGSLVYVAFILGVLGLFQPSGGVLAEFTRDGKVSLGGNAGYAIAGPVVWQGVARVLFAFVVASFIAVPSLTLDLVTSLSRLLVYIYLFSIVAVRGIVSALRHMYRLEPASGDSESGGTDGVVESPTPSEGVSTRHGARPRAAPASRIERPVSRAPALPSEVPRRAQVMLAATQPVADEEIEQDLEMAPEPKPEMVPVTGNEVESEQALPAGGRYNRFWHTPATAQEDREDLNAEDAHYDEAGAVAVHHELAASWARPNTDLLVDADDGGISKEQMAETGEIITRTLAEYAVEVEIGEIKPGPTVSMYGLVPGWVRRHKQVKVTDEHGQAKLDESGKPVIARVETKTRVKVDSIMSREKDLALALKTRSIRIETPAMGKSLVGIEVPNPTSDLVTLRSVMESKEFKKLRASAALPIALGKGTGGETVVLDLAQMPHLLIAGATGSGKSVCLNTIVSCLIMEKTPAEMRLFLVDPKRVELTPYNGIPHLLTKVVVETDKVVGLLKGLIREMLSRYRRMEEVGVRNIEAYNKRMPEKMPFLVVAVDELADLMMSASFDVEQSLCRLAQLGRATGIHLIIATQRPSVDVVTGLIKANFPSRVSFAVSSQIDSRTILDSVGAEKLLGRGDMLYLAVDSSRPERVQGVYISDQEIEGLVGFWRTAPRAEIPNVSLHAVRADDPEVENAQDGNEHSDRDELLDKAIELAHNFKKMSTSLLQRRMRVGYPRAARLMDQLEEAGIVGPSDGSKSRDVIMSKGLAG